MFYGLGIAGATMGIVGMGPIGQAVATRLKGWGATLLYSQPDALPVADEEALGVTRKTLEELLAQSDIVILALPLTKQTLHTINAARLALMKPGAFLVNPCRGSVVDEAAVLEALASGQLGGYAADVLKWKIGQGRTVRRRFAPNCGPTQTRYSLRTSALRFRMCG
ncbi:hypothetical protein HSBAA_44910 [Vreelandella sulfidaeris]|uniref:D-isomer specific 2-hydroxyacid dehydrogenase NAD-binding domain-containing protein n=1 Tax=Vreelandella sulfidaeris TaxID=115553 RepID=A0A455UAY1_9GAMM|nr:hypothetical protein HSBAA_44910 [Halomonas sulfidaeris]